MIRSYSFMRCYLIFSFYYFLLVLSSQYSILRTLLKYRIHPDFQGSLLYSSYVWILLPLLKQTNSLFYWFHKSSRKLKTYMMIVYYSYEIWNSYIRFFWIILYQNFRIISPVNSIFSNFLVTLCLQLSSLQWMELLLMLSVFYHYNKLEN